MTDYHLTEFLFNVAVSVSVFPSHLRLKSTEYWDELGKCL